MANTKNKRDLQKEKNENYVVNEHLYKRLDSIIQILGGIKFAIPRGGKDITDDWKEFQKRAREIDKETNRALSKIARQEVEDDYKERGLKLHSIAIIISIISACISLVSLIFSLALFYFYNQT
jgi:ABC-type ATPase fused to a predicted acetyltransferase domain